MKVLEQALRQYRHNNSQSLFCDMPKNQNYIKAKEASLRAHFY
jgi:hypothetical protein